MVKYFDGVLNLLTKPFECLLKIYEPFWYWLVKHDKYVYLILLIVVLLFTFE